MAKIMIIDGSPRMKGNTAALCEEVGRGITEAEGEYEIIKIQKQSINPCLACDACQNKLKSQCAQRDDMNSLYPQLMEADGIIFATPIYWWSVTAQMKAFIDRLYALSKGSDNTLEGKKMAVVLVYGDDNHRSSGALNAIGSFKNMFSWIKSQYNEIIYGTAFEAGVVKNNTSFMKKAFDLGKEIANN